MDVKIGLRGYIGHITIDSELEEVKIVVTEKATSRVSVLQSNGSWEESARVELPSYQLNIK